MKGHLRPRNKAETCWEITIYQGRGPDGKPQYAYHSFRGGKREAQNERARLVHEYVTGQSVQRSDTTLALFLRDWLRTMRPNLAGTTWERYTGIVNLHIIPALGHWRLSKLTPLHIQRYYSDALTKGRRDGTGGLSARTVLQGHRILRHALQDAVRWQVITHNPCDGVTPPRITHKDKVILTPDEVETLLAAVRGTRFYMPALLAVGTGMRRGEVFGLMWEDIDWDASCLYLRRSLEETKAGLAFKEPKSTRGRRLITLPSTLMDALRAEWERQQAAKERAGDLYHEHGLVCPAHDGRPASPDDFTSAWTRMLKDKGLKRLPYHNLRHTHATWLLMQGIHPKIVQERLGHSTISVTMDIYSQFLPSMGEESARRIDELLRRNIGNSLATPENESPEETNSG